MNILCVIDSLNQGGAQRQLIGLALGFKEKGHDVSFLTYHDIPFFNHLLDNSGIKITCIVEPRYLIRILKMRVFIREGKYDAVLSFLEASGFICEIVGFPIRKWKLIVGERSTNPNIVKSFKLKAYRWFHIFSDYVVANSNANMQLVRSINPLLSKSKCKVIYNTIDLNLWKPSLVYTPRKDGKLKIIVAARDHPYKNLHGLIEALSDLSISEREVVKIEWYGIDKMDQIQKEYSKINEYHLENVISLFPGTTEMIRITQDADVVGLFSFYEGFPNAVCEGMACGKTVICSSVSDLPIFLSGNKNLLCDPHDPISIANVIRYAMHLTNEELIQMGQENRKSAEIHFNKDSIISQYLTLFS
ncbi:MAG TPA: glycosyltransferase family 4 protein [Paludibacter sp.]